MDDPLYRDEILDHYHSSPYRGHIEGCSLCAELDNPLCGDHIVLQLELDASGEKIERVRFDGQGCALSQAGASMLAEEIEGKTVGEARAFNDQAMMKLLGVHLTPTRIKCWLLGWRAMQHALPADVMPRGGIPG